MKISMITLGLSVNEKIYSEHYTVRKSIVPVNLIIVSVSMFLKYRK